MNLSCLGIGLVAMTFIAAITHQLHGFKLLLTTSLKYTVLIPGWKISVLQQQCPTMINVIDSLLIHFFTLALLVSIFNIVLSICLFVTNNFPHLIVSFCLCSLSRGAKGGGQEAKGVTWRVSISPHFSWS